MPSLMPGMPGTKEAYGISVINADQSVNIPPKAFVRYGLRDNGIVLLTSTHKGEGGFAILNRDKAYRSVFKSTIDRIQSLDTAIWIRDRAYALTNLVDKKVVLNDHLLITFNLKVGARLMVVKSTTVAMSFTPVEIWKKKFEDRGMIEAVKNMSKLEIF